MADAQLAVARAHGFASWRALEEHVERGALQASHPDEEAVPPAAVDFGHLELVEWLLAHSGSLYARSANVSRHTALHSAAWNGDLRMVTLLVEAGADPSVRDEEHDDTALGWAETSIEVTNNPKCAEVAAYLRQVTPRRSE